MFNMSKKSIKKEINKIKAKIIQRYQPEKIIIFGSFAWGKPGSDSDLDIFLLKKTKKTPRERRLEVGRILLDRRIPIDILVYTPREAKNRLELGDFFIEEIFKKGKLIYEKK